MTRLECEASVVPKSLPGQDLPMEEAGDVGQVAEMVRQGRALLKIIATPWGVEFYLHREGEE